MNKTKYLLTNEEKEVFNRWLSARKDNAEANLKACFNNHFKKKDSIHEAMCYALYNGGKRLRPIMVYEGAAIAGAEIQKVAPAACALEMIHCYSLVHDDLPAMDDDDYRRGKPTCHKVFGEAMAILAGDALLTGAFELLASIPCQNDQDQIRLLRVIAELSSAAGSSGMIGGQVIDLESEGKSIDYPTLVNLHALKTGKLFIAALRTGAILGGIDDMKLHKLTEYGLHFGQAFQITDDILVITGDEKEVGKPLGSDEKNSKNTYPSIFGLEKSLQMAKEQINKCILSLNDFGKEADFLRWLAYYILSRSS